MTMSSKIQIRKFCDRTFMREVTRHLVFDCKHTTILIIIHRVHLTDRVSNSAIVFCNLHPTRLVLHLQSLMGPLLTWRAHKPTRYYHGISVRDGTSRSETIRLMQKTFRCVCEILKIIYILKL